MRLEQLARTWRWCKRHRQSIFGVAAVLCLYGYLYLDDAQDPSDPVPPRPVTLGVYVSDHDEEVLEALLPGQHAGGEPAWQVQVQAARAGGGTAAVEFSFGPLVPNGYGSTRIGYSTATVSGNLRHPIHLAFELPAGTTYVSHTVATLSAGSATDTCAQWTAEGTVHTAMPHLLRGSGGSPDFVVCDIPALPSVEALRIVVDATITAPALAQSWTGQSAIAISNPITLQLTADQDNGTVPPDLVNGTSQPYHLYVQPPDGVEFTDSQPAPASVGLQTRQWLVGSGGYVSAKMIDSHRRNLVDTGQQTLLILGSSFVALITAVRLRD